MSFCHNEGPLGVLTGALGMVSSRFNLIAIRKVIVTTLHWRKRSWSWMCVGSQRIHKWLLEASDWWLRVRHSEATIVMVDIGVPARTVAVVFDWTDISCV